MKLMIVTDAWEPQVNGVVRTLKRTKLGLEQAGFDVSMVTPLGSRTVACPTYSEIQLTLSPFRKVSEHIEEHRPDFIHISTEGPLGWSARKFCKLQGLNFTTSFHTRFAEYLHARTRLPIGLTYKVLRRFHYPSRYTMVTTPSMQRRLASFGFNNLRPWGRGVDTELFRPFERETTRAKPIAMYVGRVAVEKNLEAFLSLNIDCEKYIVGDGPQRKELQAKYPKAIFTGKKFGEELARLYAMADVFVFPSKTDTFGLVMLEALASGTPVAAYPFEGPIDVIRSSEVGCLDLDLELATKKALKLSRKRCREYALGYSWSNAVSQFSSNLVLAR
ncbi:MAG: glycosyltransferase family 1 protein [Bdellovibrionales bacterium]|nr:glycosyltransferase family 1 protein [Bdellovibrionales bacterium]